MQIKKTGDQSIAHVNFLVYSAAGIGKTVLASTMPKPLILSAESGLLSIKDKNVDFVEIKSLADLKDAYLIASRSDHESIVLDSLSEIAEIILLDLKGQKTSKGNSVDGRAAYGEMQDTLASVIRGFRDLPKHFLATAKLDRVQDENGMLLYSPMMPSKTSSQALPYLFDEVFAIRIQDLDGVKYRYLQCQPDGIWLAKDRSGKLAEKEKADLTFIIDQIFGGKKNEQ